MMARKSLAAICAELALGAVLFSTADQAAALLAGQPYYDYYDPKSQHVIGSVNLHHLSQAEETLRKRRASLDPGVNRNLLESAADDLRFVLDYLPNDPRALFMLVGVALELKRPELIEKYLDDALQTFPNTASTWTIQGIYLARVGRLDAAIDSYKRALALKPNDMQTHYDLGLAYAEKRNWMLANQHAQAAYRLGAPLAGLKEKLVKAGAWNPSQGSDTGSNEGARAATPAGASSKESPRLAPSPKPATR